MSNGQPASRVGVHASDFARYTLLQIGLDVRFSVPFVFPMQYRLYVGEAHSFEKDLGQRFRLALWFVFVLIVVFAVFGGGPGGGSDGTPRHGGSVNHYARREFGLEGSARE